MGNRRFLKGAFFLSVSMFATKLLGALYVIPFQRLVGETGMALYNYAYVPYALFISLATLGIPLGISKFIAKYNTDGAYATSRKILNFSLVFMTLLGVLGFLGMYLLAPWYARFVLGEEGGLVNTVEDITRVMRMISFAVLVIPPMSIIRGFFQGNQDMIPTSVSQFVEQVIRIAFILVGAYYIIHIREGSQTEAVIFSVFSAFLAGIASLAVLVFYWLKNRKKYTNLLKVSVPSENNDSRKLFSELISYAIPFAILGLGTILFQFIDQGTYNYFMMASGVSETVSQATYGVYASLYKIVMIPVSFAIAFGQPLIPELTHQMTKGSSSGVRKTLMLAIQLTFFITVPAVVGISLLSKPVFYIFVSSNLAEINAMGGQIFGLGAFLGLFIALYSITNAILQGIGEQRYGVISLSIALIIKLVGNVILIYLFQVNGVIISTMIAYIFCIVMNLTVIRKKTGFNLKKLGHRLVPPVVFTGIMTLGVIPTKFILDRLITYEGSTAMSSLYVGVVGTVGALIYLGLCLYFNMFKTLFGLRRGRKI